MKIVRGSNNLRSKKPVVLTMGNFDGCHLGHMEIFKALTKAAEAARGEACVYTFDPHPAKVMAPASGLKLLQTEEQKLRSLKAAGIDICVIENYDLAFARTPARDFLHKIILDRIAPGQIIVGHDLTFGWHRKGTVEMMENFCRAEGIKFALIAPFFKNEILISSSQVRSYVSTGEMQQAADCLGRPYSIKGRVIKGRGIGRVIGIHTANLSVENELIPPSGVYITRTLDKLSLTNIGYNPTVGGSVLSIETHIMDFDGDLYKRELEVYFQKRIRAEMVFRDVSALKAQIMKDISQAKKYEKI